MSVFAGNNTYSGGLIVENGTAKAGIENNAGSGPLRVLAGAAVDLASFGATVGGLAGAGNVLLGQGTLTLEQNSASIFWRHVGQGRSDQERIGSANACWRQQLCRCHRCQPWCLSGAQALSAASAYWVDRGQRCGWAASIQAWPRSTMQAWSHLAVAAARRFRWRATMSATTARLSSTRYWAMTTENRPAEDRGRYIGRYERTGDQP